MYDPSLCTLPTYMHQFRLHTTCRKQLIEALSSFSFFSPQIPNMEKQVWFLLVRACRRKPKWCHPHRSVTQHTTVKPHYINPKPKTPDPRVRVAETDTHRNDTHRMIDFWKWRIIEWNPTILIEACATTNLVGTLRDQLMFLWFAEQHRSLEHCV